MLRHIHARSSPACPISTTVLLVGPPNAPNRTIGMARPCGPRIRSGAGRSG